MEIPLNPQEGKSIYDYGFDAGLNRSIPDNSTGVVYDTVDNQTNTGSMVNGGNLTLKTLSIGGLVRQVAPGDDIQAAIDAVSREGGGTVQLLAKTYNPTSDIRVREGVRFIGSGRDSTVLDFAGAPYKVYVLGSQASSVENFSIGDLTVARSSSTYSIQIEYADYWEMFNVRSTNNSGIGVRIAYCESFITRNVRTDNNTGHGFTLYGDGSPTTNATNSYSIDLCQSDNNTGDGFYSDVDTNDNVPTGQFRGCYATANSGNGFSAVGSNPEIYLACLTFFNTSNGFFQSSGSNGGKRFNSCIAAQDTGYGFYITGGDVSLINNEDIASSLGSRVSTTGKVFCIGHSRPIDILSTSDTRGNIFPTRTLADNVFGGDTDGPHNNLRYYFLNNNSGATIPAGAVVVFNAGTSEDSVTTTTTNGDSKVCGMASVAMTNGRPAAVMVQGRTTAKLLVTNGASSILAGDWLSTYSHAYYAKKAVAGETAFAMALSTPTTGTASISALLISPRMI